MRNILTILSLCVIALTTSSVRAENYDESNRTERFGLSYYDGRPLYVVMFALTYDGSGKSNGFGMAYYRMYTGDRLDDFGQADFTSYNGQGRSAVVRYGNLQVHERYFYSVIDSEGMVVYTGHPAYVYPYTDWTRELLKQYPPPKYTSEDIGVNIFDALLKPLQEWLGGALGFWLTIGVVFLGWQYLRRLVRGGVAISGKSAEVEASNEDFLEGFRRRRAEKFAAEQEREKFESFQKAWGAIRELGEADAYATGEAFGLTFTDKVVKSNLILQEAWSRLSKDERSFLANEARALAWQDDLIGEKEKIYRQAAMETALGDLDGVDASLVFSNPFEDATYYDDDNGGTPF